MEEKLCHDSLPTKHKPYALPAHIPNARRASASVTAVTNATALSRTCSLSSEYVCQGAQGLGLRVEGFDLLRVIDVCVPETPPRGGAARIDGKIVDTLPGAPLAARSPKYVG